MPERDTFGAGGWRDEIRRKVRRKVVESQRTPTLKRRQKNVFGTVGSIRFNKQAAENKEKL